MHAAQTDSRVTPSNADSIVGSGEAVATRLERIADESGADRLNLSAAVQYESYRDLADHVIPVLRERGRVREHVPGRTLRESLFETSSPLLPADHPGARFRGAFAGAPSSAPTLL
ncbi:hypothetical protein ACQP0C_17645 [Nocardia sp. CA-129566]|uniref:hypothetical protein n=1 Tax=Nocardia sp. CA-129566 TaxID=3239976 RepID=UPI003D97CA19